MAKWAWLAVATVVLAGCQTKDEVMKAAANHADAPHADAGHAESHEGHGDVVHASKLAKDHAATGTLIGELAQGGGAETAIVFPNSTRPSDKPSLTPNGYWTPMRKNREPNMPHHGGEHSEAHGEAAHGPAATAGHSENHAPTSAPAPAHEPHPGHGEPGHSH